MKWKKQNNFINEVPHFSRHFVYKNYFFGRWGNRFGVCFNKWYDNNYIVIKKIVDYSTKIKYIIIS